MNFQHKKCLFAGKREKVFTRLMELNVTEMEAYVLSAQQSQKSLEKD
jgi:hypothetical protein